MIIDITKECTSMDPELSTFIHNLIVIIKIAVPIVLVIFGMLDFGKGVIAGKEDEIKKGQNTFIKRLIAASVVFLMITITQFVINIIDRESSGQIWNCANLIINGRAGQELTEDDERQIRNSVIEECCKSASGEVMKSHSGTSCMNPIEEEYNACYKKKLGGED